MVHLATIRGIVGWSFKCLGLFWSFADRFLCGGICDVKCTHAQSNICSLLFLFVGIIFIVSGYTLLIMKDKGRKRLKAKVKRVIKLTGI